MSMGIKIIEFASVSPSQGTEQSLPLLYFDTRWFGCRPTETVYFYTLKCSESYFLHRVIVQLKQSLSVTLKNFLPLAGKVIFPLTSAAMPVLRYSNDNSVPLTIALSDADFADMTANHCKPAHELHHLVRQLPPPVHSDNDIIFSPVAVQVTLFPNQGICIGFTVHHVMCDGRSLVDFIHAWASVNKLNGDEHLVGDALPFYDRSRIPYTTEFDFISWAKEKMSQPNVEFTNYLPPQLVRATFILNDAQIERLKKLAMMKKPGIGKVSSFVAVCAYFWSCLIKSGEEAADNETEILCSPVDCRGRLEPSLPENYFGNCTSGLYPDLAHGKLRRNEGFAAAVEAIAAAVGGTAIYGGGVAEYFRNLLQGSLDLTGKRVTLFIGSIRLDHYGADYGWGRPIKYECIHTDFEGSFNLCKGRDGGVEIGMSMPKAKMDAFAAIFNRELHINSNL